MSRRKSHPLLKVKNDAYMALIRYENEVREGRKPENPEEHERMRSAFHAAKDEHDRAGRPLLVGDKP